MIKYDEYDKQIDLDAQVPEKEPERQYYFMEVLKGWAQSEKERLGRDLTYNVQTFGCQMNIELRNVKAA